MVAEIALSCGLLVATGLMVKSVVELRTHDYGFPVDGLFTARIGLFESDYPTPEDRVRFFDELRSRLAERPDVRAAGLTDSLPVLGSPARPLRPRGEATADDADLPRARQVTVSPGFFETFGVQPLSGRLFTAHDRRDSQAVALVNRPFAERYFPGERPDRPPGAPRPGGRGGPEGAERALADDRRRGAGHGRWAAPRDEDPEGIYVPLAQSDVRVRLAGRPHRGRPDGPDPGGARDGRRPRPVPADLLGARR